MCKRIVSIILILVLTLSLASCSVLESIPGLEGIFGDHGSTDTPGDDETPDDETPGEDEKPGDNDGGNTEEKPDDGNNDNTEEKPDDGNNDNTDEKPDDGNGDDNTDEKPVCDCWADADRDAICDNCGSGGLLPPDEPPYCEDGCRDTDGDAICDNCGSGVPVPPEVIIPTIFLAGDSTVKTYEDGQYIGGWGQFLSLFLGEEVVVKNAAHGGRSSRSFINEGRLYDIEGSNYTFSQNGGNSIGDEIVAGDYLFIQFGHNDDASKLSNYQTIYDRMVPLGKPDANGIYPVTPAVKQPTTYLPDDYYDTATDSEITKALSEIAKYGDEYYAYGDGTYKWYLKQYIDFAREKGAIPVLITPVARVKFNSAGEIIGGAGLHGDNFAYVQAVRQLAEEEDCLLIDLFAESKAMLETATPTYANYLMALKPNDLTGAWPSGYDAAYGNVEAGYTGIEATHYNKYGAFLQAAAVVKNVLANEDSYSFANYILSNPTKYIDPSNLIGKNTVAAIEALFTTINVTNPDRWYAKPEDVISKIEQIEITFGEITAENYVEVGMLCELVREAYYCLNVDDRPLVTNYAVLEAAEARVKELELASRPAPTRVVIFNADNLSGGLYNSTVTEGDFTFVATSDKTMEKKSKSAAFTYNGTSYELKNGLSVGGSAKFGQSRYVSFTVDGPCSITIAVQSSSSSAVRTLNLVNSSNSVIGSYEAGTSVTVGTVELDKAGTYSVGSAGSGMYIFMIIIEYFE